MYLSLISAVSAVALFVFVGMPMPDSLPQFPQEPNAARVQAQQQAAQTIQTPRDIILSEDRIQHILFGDATGGGHKFGTGKPCKSEFPQDWDTNKILDTTKRIAANDNLNWRQQDNGYFVVESMEGTLNVRVVLGPQKQRVITAYPINVERNACP
ncbi:MAG: EndoU domain-containing protein [Pseudomonadota bacterium]